MEEKKEFQFVDEEEIEIVELFGLTLKNAEEIVLERSEACL